MDRHEPTPRLRLRYPPPWREGFSRSDSPSGRVASAPPDRFLPPPSPVAGAEPRNPTDKPVLDSMDPRWVLAVRASGLLRGGVLRPRDRESLLRLSRVMGLRAFEANLVIAVVQDRARRGLGMRGAADMLRFVPRPTGPRDAKPRKGRIALWTAAVLLAELLVVVSMI